MTPKTKSLRTPRGQAGGLGSAKHGVEHWWAQRVSAIALVFLSIYIAVTFVVNVVFGAYEDAVGWLSSPLDATVVILFIVTAFYHAALGLQVVIEDYVHTEGVKIASILAAKFACAVCGAFGVILVIETLFWSNLPHS